jgi:hypothetical protein
LINSTGDLATLRIGADRMQQQYQHQLQHPQYMLYAVLYVLMPFSIILIASLPLK